jgi:hypothetical protein
MNWGEKRIWFLLWQLLWHIDISYWNVKLGELGLWLSFKKIMGEKQVSLNKKKQGGRGAIDLEIDFFGKD